MEVYEITLIELSTKKEINIPVEVDEAEESENIVIYSKVKYHEVTSISDTYFIAYQEFRDELLALGYGIKCNGSRINAVQSGMMGATDKVYLVEMGKQALKKDIVNIWDYADIDIFANTQQQNSFFDQWINSL
ncbi:MAG: hypothetical protein II233_02640 [Clostridia bacterium]|nr:hypothetical protein [Clostridia bacterium]